MITILKLARDGDLQISQSLDRRLLSFADEDAIWVDLENPTEEEASVLKDPFKFHPLAIEDCLGEVEYPKLDAYDGYIFIVLHGINWQAGAGRFTTAQVDIFLGRNFLVTHHRHTMRSVRQAIDRCKGDPKIMANGLDLLLHLILDRMVDHYFPELEKLEDRIEGLEEEIFVGSREAVLDKIFEIKREVMHLKRIVFPQREVFNRLSRDDSPFVKPATRLYFRDIYDNLSRMTDAADTYREMLGGALDAYLFTVSNTINHAMKTLTIIATLFVPVLVGSSLYGMNFHHLPGSHSPYGFYAAIGIMLGLSAILLLYIKKKGWF